MANRWLELASRRGFWVRLDSQPPMLAKKAADNKVWWCFEWPVKITGYSILKFDFSVNAWVELYTVGFAISVNPGDSLTIPIGGVISGLGL